MLQSPVRSSGASSRLVRQLTLVTTEAYCGEAHGPFLRRGARIFLVGSGKGMRNPSLKRAGLNRSSTELCISGLSLYR